MSLIDSDSFRCWMSLFDSFEAKTREDFLQSLKKYAKKLKASDPGDSKRDSLDAQGMKHTEASRKGQGQGPKKADKDIFNLARDRLISAMLIEPEVLHVVYCFQHQFRILFNCYAPKGHMQFTELWQFCVDFQLTPRFIPEQQLRRAYEAAECFLVLAPRLVRKPPRASKARAKPRMERDVPKLHRHRFHQHQGRKGNAFTAPTPQCLRLFQKMSSTSAKPFLVQMLLLRHFAG